MSMKLVQCLLLLAASVFTGFIGFDALLKRSNLLAGMMLAASVILFCLAKWVIK